MIKVMRSEDRKIPIENANFAHKNRPFFHLVFLESQDVWRALIKF
jgi:hypothetical protein